VEKRSRRSDPLTLNDRISQATRERLGELLVLFAELPEKQQEAHLHLVRYCARGILPSPTPTIEEPLTKIYSDTEGLLRDIIVRRSSPRH
jgi:hypothetical protein